MSQDKKFTTNTQPNTFSVLRKATVGIKSFRVTFGLFFIACVCMGTVC